MANYQLHLDTLLKRSQAEQEAYETKRKQQATSAAQQIERLYEDLISSSERDYRASAAATEAGYRRQYDANAVAELVARRHAADAVANANAVNSGLNHTQQTAISLIRGNADVQTSAQKQAAVDSIMRELDSLRTKYRTESVNKQATVYEDALEDITDYMTRREEAARDDAYKLYQADLDKEKALRKEMPSGGSKYGAKNTPSEPQIRSEAIMIRKRQGDAFADIYLTQKVNLGQITPIEKKEIMKKIGMSEVIRPSDDEVRAEAKRLLSEEGKTAAYEYVKNLYDTGMIFIRLREELYDLIGVM